MSNLMKRIINYAIIVLMFFLAIYECRTIIELTDNNVYTETVMILEKKEARQNGHIKALRPSSYYMIAVDGEGNSYKVMKWGAQVGDVITIYTTKLQHDSSEPAWYSSMSDLRMSNIMYIVTGAVLLIVLFLISRSLRKSYKSPKNDVNNNQYQGYNQNVNNQYQGYNQNVNNNQYQGYNQNVNNQYQGFNQNNN